MLTVPVQVEVYPDHEDFAVRTMGMPGLGALGVTFGYRGRHGFAQRRDPQRGPAVSIGTALMWHEMSHVYVLSMTDQPRAALVHRRAGGV